jgi:uncharacterized membrane protein YcaP (DUF421 family)
MEGCVLLTLFIRTIILYLVIFTIMRLLGKRQLSDLQPFDLVLTIIIANLAQAPLTNTGVPLFYGLMPMLCVFLLEALAAFIARKSEKAHSFLCGRPSLVVNRGVIVEEELKNIRLTISDLLALLRGKGARSIGEVEYAIIETDGTLSVLFKSDKRPLTPADMNIAPQQEVYPRLLIDNGAVRLDELRRAGLDDNWLKKPLAQLGIIQTEDVFIALLDDSKTLYVQPKCGKMLSVSVSAPEN